MAVDNDNGRYDTGTRTHVIASRVRLGANSFETLLGSNLEILHEKTRIFRSGQRAFLFAEALIKFHQVNMSAFMVMVRPQRNGGADVLY